MKEWCLKHPILAFLLLDKFICALEALFRGARRMSLSERVVDDVNDIGTTILQEVKASKNEDRTIGFKAS